MTNDNERFALLEQLLRDRHSCRGFRPEPVPRATIEAILALAQRTASWCNAQPWQVHVLSAPATARLRDDLVAHARSHPPQPDLDFPGAYVGVYQERRRECGLQLYQATGVQRGDQAASERQWLENYRLFGAPHLAIVTTPAPLGTYAAVDCGAYVHNFMLAAHALGVASIAQAAQAAVAGFWRERLGAAAGPQGGVRHRLRLRGSGAPRQRFPHFARPTRAGGAMGRMRERFSAPAPAAAPSA